jgi:hypothetical protein
MTLLSPFNVRSPVFLVELFQARHIIDKLGFRRVSGGMIFFGCADDEVYNTGKAATASTTLLHCVIDLGRHNQLPTVFIEKPVDDILDFPIGNVIATAYEHGVLAVKHDMRYLLFINKITDVKKKCGNSFTSLRWGRRDWRLLMKVPALRQNAGIDIRFRRGGYRI